MKKLLTLAAMFTAIALSSCKYDDDDLWSSVHGLEDRVAKLAMQTDEHEYRVAAGHCKRFAGE